MSVKRIRATELARNHGAVTHAVEHERQTVIVTEHGRDAVVLLHPDEYAALVEDKETLDGIER